MGERTQMLVSISTIGRDGKHSETAAISLHYQWGFGRIMLMDALTVGWGLLNASLERRPVSTQVAAAMIMGLSVTGTPNYGSGKHGAWTIYADEKALQKQGIPLYHETLESVIEHSDNNDGYCHLDILADLRPDHKSTSALITLYDSEGHRVNLHDYIERGGGRLFATLEFEESYAALLRAINIELNA